MFESIAFVFSSKNKICLKTLYFVLKQKQNILQTKRFTTFVKRLKIIRFLIYRKLFKITFK